MTRPLAVVLVALGLLAPVGSLPAHAGSWPTLSRAEQRILLDVVLRANDERQARGVQSLTFSDRLSTYAQLYALSMASTRRLSHRADLGALLGDFGATAAAENIGGTPSLDAGEDAHVMWMRSDEHRLNLVNPGFDHVGVGVACRDGVAWVSVLFLRLGGVPMRVSTPPRRPVVRTDWNPFAGRAC